MVPEVIIRYAPSYCARDGWVRQDSLPYPSQMEIKWFSCHSLYSVSSYQGLLSTHSGSHHRFILQWRHNEHDGISNDQPHECLLNRLFRRRSKKTPKLRVTGFVRGIHRRLVNSPHKGPVKRKIFHLMTSSWVDDWWPVHHKPWHKPFQHNSPWLPFWFITFL